jgi:hypothetical protein
MTVLPNTAAYHTYVLIKEYLITWTPVHAALLKTDFSTGCKFGYKNFFLLDIETFLYNKHPSINTCFYDTPVFTN